MNFELQIKLMILDAIFMTCMKPCEELKGIM